MPVLSRGVTMVLQRAGSRSASTVMTMVLKRAQKWLIFTSKWTTVWHHGMVHALLNTHLPSFHSPIAMEEQQRSLQSPT